MQIQNRAICEIVQLASKRNKTHAVREIFLHIINMGKITYSSEYRISGVRKVFRGHFELPEAT